MLILEDLRLLDKLRLDLLTAAEVQEHEREGAAEKREHLLQEREDFFGEIVSDFQ